MAVSIHDSLKQWLDEYLTSSRTGHAEGLKAAADHLAAASRISDDELDAAGVLETLNVLARLSPDPATVAAALLVPVARSGDELPDALVSALPAEVGTLLVSFDRLVSFGRSYLPDDHGRAEGLRRLLLALVDDVRVVLVALAWQLARLRGARRLESADRRRLGRETQLIHAPLANRLGVWQLKWELEDLAFGILEPDTYRRIARLVDERRTSREAFITSFMKELERVLAEADISGQISGRPKHIYSIWRKMQRKGLDFHELFDVRAVRVLTDSVADCYSVLGLVHTRWQPVPGEFDDYITNPKGNLYQSLHTAVVAAGGRVVEVQIRTHDMHRHAELGVAAHWRYKEGGPRDSALEERITVMRQLLDAGGDDLDDASLLENFQSLTTEDRVYVLTPAGQVVDMPAGATVLDFAYHIHTEVGHCCKGARVNGRIVPLTTQVENGQRVEILTGREPQPSRDWLVQRLGYIRTGRARAKVRQWFRQAHYEENRAAGRQWVDSELERMDLTGADLRPVTRRYNLTRVDDLYVAVGNGDLTATQVAHAVARESGEAVTKLPGARRGRGDDSPAPDEITIEGTGNLMYQLARCCQPLPGDAIAGYLTRTRGVSVHRADCAQFARLSRQAPERVLEVDWGRRPGREYPVHLRLEAWDRKGLIKDIGAVLAADGVSVSAMNGGGRDEDARIQLDLTLRITDFEQLSAVMDRLRSVAGIDRVVRRVEDPTVRRDQ